MNEAPPRMLTLSDLEQIRNVNAKVKKETGQELLHVVHRDDPTQSIAAYCARFPATAATEDIPIRPPHFLPHIPDPPPGHVVVVHPFDPQIWATAPAGGVEEQELANHMSLLAMGQWNPVAEGGPQGVAVDGDDEPPSEEPATAAADALVDFLRQQEATALRRLPSSRMPVEEPDLEAEAEALLREEDEEEELQTCPPSSPLGSDLPTVIEAPFGKSLA